MICCTRHSPHTVRILTNIELFFSFVWKRFLYLQIILQNKTLLVSQFFKILSQLNSPKILKTGFIIKLRSLSLYLIAESLKLGHNPETVCYM